MGTDKILVKSTDKFLADYNPVYKPIFPLFKSVKYTEEVGKLNFKRIETIGDLRAHLVFPKDTEISRIHAKESEKTFKKYFRGSQYVQSGLQSQEGAQTVVNQVLDYLNIQFDSILMTGEGTDANTVLNNGLFWSGDSNYKANSSSEIAASGKLFNFHAYIMEQAHIANQIAGKKIAIFYGNTITQLQALFPDVAVPFKKVLAETLGSDYSIIEMPAASTPSSAHGFLIINVDQVVAHYIKTPILEDSGYDARQKEYWWNFFFGSVMIEVLAENAIVKSPITWGS